MLPITTMKSQDVNNLESIPYEEYKALEERNKQLRAENDFLRKANAELDNFVYRVSHDLRAPISSSLGLLDIIKGEQDPQMCQEYLGMMEKALQKQDAFIRDILDYSRNTRMDVSKDMIQWHDLVQDTLKQLQHIPERERIDIRLTVHQTDSFCSDVKRIGVVLNNLVANAIRYSNPYEKNPYIRIDIQVDEKGTSLRLSDNGIGIAKEHQLKIFDMFYRANDRKPGSGLGLYIVKESIQKLSGKLSLSSKIGEGTSFDIYLPNLLSVIA